MSIESTFVFIEFGSGNRRMMSILGVQIKNIFLSCFEKVEVCVKERMLRLTGQLYEQFAENARMEEVIRKNLEELGYGE